MWPDILMMKLVVYAFLPHPSSAPPFFCPALPFPSSLKPPTLSLPFPFTLCVRQCPPPFPFTLCVRQCPPRNPSGLPWLFSSLLGSTGFPSLTHRSKVLSQEQPMREHMQLLTFWLWATLLIIIFENTLSVCWSWEKGVKPSL